MLYEVITDDPRLIKKADASKGEAGSYSVYWEGFDNDNDGFINEDPKGGVDINRNFMHEYPYYKDDAGHHMVSENESIRITSYNVCYTKLLRMIPASVSGILYSPDSMLPRMSLSASMKDC